MFHVEQFFFDGAFHVKRKSSKTYCLVEFLRILGGQKIIFDLSPCLFL